MLDDVRRAYEFGPFRFDVRGRMLTRGGKLVPLTPKAADLLLALVKDHGRLVAKDDLIKAVWPDTFVADSSLSFQLNQLRQALGPRPEGGQYIETLPRRGYQFAAPVRVLSEVDVIPIDAAPESANPSLEELIQPPKPPAATDQRVPSLDRRRRRWLPAGAMATGAVLLFLLLALKPSPPPLTIGRIVQLTNDGRAKAQTSLFPYARRVYFETLPGRVASVPIHGGDTAPSPASLEGFEVLDISAARSEYLVVKRNTPSIGPNELWAVSTVTGSRRRISDIMCESAAWSHDGEWIVYTTDSDLFVIKADGTASRRIPTVAGGSPRWPRWSPDGRLLRFTVYLPGDREPTSALWEVRADGTHLGPLLPNWHRSPSECCGTWSADGKLFIFQTGSNWRSTLWVLREASGLLPGSRAKPVQLTSGPRSYEMPVLSEDGTTLFALGVPDRGELVRFDTTRHEFVPYLGGISATWVTFSRDARWVTYVSWPENTLWRSRVDGSEKRQLTFEPMVVDGPSWSPDGNRIAFRGRRPGMHAKIYLIGAEGGQPEELTPEDVERGLPTWSHEGTRLSFGDVPETFGQPAGNEVIHIYNLARRGSVALTGSELLWSSNWSRDGMYLAALTIRGQKLRLFDFNSREWRDTEAEHVSTATWSRDGFDIYYDTEGTSRRLRRVHVSDGKVEELTTLDGYPSTVYWWSGLAQDDSPIILRNLGAVEVYALELERR